MKDQTLHYSTEQFNLLLDGRMPVGEARIMNEHISGCRECRQVWQDIGSIDAALGHLPIVRTSADFTSTVMDQILTVPKSPLVFRLLEKAPYVLGMLIVLGIMVVAFVVSGVFKGSDIDLTKNVVASAMTKTGEGLGATLNAFSAWLIQYVPFAFSKGSMSIAFFAVVVLVMLAGVDRAVGRRVVQK